eukprot:CAMPEP_0178738870 /NCGR_PEP_ID=MMETSP0744-20121128/3747_1 /TAXON_ID=913974 /ORGANISM="Nitzschia punctata, Strain CCMP561" /LENGTH=92 /DNA_ID=CAMNT_0020391525 /DNA_START=61 /DNA_END=339 /DNA_ORIENTATION=+
MAEEETNPPAASGEETKEEEKAPEEESTAHFEPVVSSYFSHQVRGFGPRRRVLDVRNTVCRRISTVRFRACLKNDRTQSPTHTHDEVATAAT